MKQSQWQRQRWSWRKWEQDPTATSSQIIRNRSRKSCHWSHVPFAVKQQTSLLLRGSEVRTNTNGAQRSLRTSCQVYRQGQQILFSITTMKASPSSSRSDPAESLRRFKVYAGQCVRNAYEYVLVLQSLDDAAVLCATETCAACFYKVVS
jgi:hypothetical protein